MPVACRPERSAAAKHDQLLLLPLAARRHPGPAASRSLRPLPRTCGSRGKSDRGDHRQPKRQEHRKRGRRIDRQGFDGGKKIKGKKRHVLVDTQGLLIEALVHAADIQDADGEPVRAVSISAEALRRWRLSGAEVPTRIGPGLPRREPRDRATVRHGSICGAAEAMERRAYHRLAQSVPSPEQRLGVLEPKCPCFPTLGVDQADGAKLCQSAA